MRASSAHSDPPIAIVGAGPTGLSLALGLARLGVRSVVVERNDATSEHSRAAGIHLRTREIFRRWGVADDVLSAGVLVRKLTQYSASTGRPLTDLDFSGLDDEADRPGLLMLEQAETERLLLDAVRESGMCRVRFGTEAAGLETDADGVRLTVRARGEEQVLGARYVVGCDGAGSFVRDALGLPFEGITYSIRPMLADVRVSDGRDALPWPRIRNGRGGLTVGLRIRPGLWRIIRIERGGRNGAEEVPDAEVGARVDEVLGPGPLGVVWASRFRIHRRASPRFRVGRVLLAGDAAHVHSPVGGLGMNAGVQDANNLAWKLAFALRGGEVDRLLDSYEVERRAVVVERVSRFTDLLTRLFLQAPSFLRGGALAMLGAALRIDRVHRRMVRTIAMIDPGYPASPVLRPGDRSAGARLPNPRLRSPAGATVRLHDLLPPEAAILAVAAPGGAGVVGPVERVIRIGDGGYQDATGVLHGLAGGRGGWILVRPDAHVAWARSRPDGMADAVRHALGWPNGVETPPSR
jgi:2-polyprenyl-6-methoxyphenol hydroxylase-like FAD-dependent oxidoreductase